MKITIATMTASSKRRAPKKSETKRGRTFVAIVESRCLTDRA